MATKKPLVLGNDGRIEQLQSGDNLANVGGDNIATLTNGNAGAAIICEVVYATNTADTFDKAQANASGTVEAIGLVADTAIASSAVGSVQTGGTFTATTAQWDAVTGESGGLTPGTKYFLSEATAGQLSTAAPSTGFIKQIGTALSATDLLLQFGPTIKL